MTTLNTPDSTDDLIETLTIAVAAVGILDNETAAKHRPRMERLLVAAQEAADFEHRRAGRRADPFGTVYEVDGAQPAEEATEA